MPAVRDGRAGALVSGLVLIVCATWAHAGGGACLALASHPDGEPLARIDASDFEIAYVHSVTRTPVVERYRLESGTIVQTELRFVEHGPGLPTEADPGQRLERREAGYVVTLDRRFREIVMRVGAAQSPRLSSGATTIDLARWGERSLLIGACGKTR